jgi:hypothetical protein
MVEAALTPQLIQEGADLVQALDAAGLTPDAAFWLYSPDINAWKLVLADVKVGSQGPREVYRQIQRTLRALSDKITILSLDDVVAAKPDAPVVSVLKKVARRAGPGIGGIRFSQSMIDGVLIEDAYIYRLAKPAAQLQRAAAARGGRG